MKIKGVSTALIDVNTSDRAVYSFTTAEEVTFTPRDGGFIYTNNSYFSKQLRLGYNMSRHFGITLKYELLSSGGATLLDHDQLTTQGGILKVSSVISYVNTLTVDLAPALARAMLKPGGSYRLKISAWEGATPQGEAAFPFSITPAGNNGALVYAADAAKDYIHFQVTLTDPQYSFMGHFGPDDMEAPEGALYAVRFTYIDETAIDDSSTPLVDEREKRLWTVYDDDIFSGNSPKKSFVLNDNTVPNTGMNPGIENGSRLRPNTVYRMYVFAVYDLDHDGQSDRAFTLVKNDPAEKRAWDYFFTNSDNYFGSLSYYNPGKSDHNEAGSGSCGTAFLDLIDHFWQSGWGNDPGLGGDPGDPGESVPNEPIWYAPMYNNIMPGFLAAQKTQRTTDTAGISINKDQATIMRNDPTRLWLVLAESFGLVNTAVNPQVQTFDRIDWSVTGYTDNASFSYNGVSYAKITGDHDADEMFVKGKDRAGYDIYSYEVPYDLPQGTYTIVIQLRKLETDINPYDTISVAYRG
jgi:hypothetical protein